MALEVIELKRIFKLGRNGDDIVLDDPNPKYSVDDVLSFFSNQFPELTTSTVHGPEIEDDKAVYSFKTTVGVKG